MAAFKGNSGSTRSFAAFVLSASIYAKLTIRFMNAGEL